MNTKLAAPVDARSALPSTSKVFKIVAVLAACASLLYTAACMNLSRIVHAWHTSDTLLMSLISTLHLTPF
ncbi:MAG: hypothetical protein ACM3S5_10650 [Rhodospirillales bacterium]